MGKESILKSLYLLSFVSSSRINKKEIVRRLNDILVLFKEIRHRVKE